MKEDIRGEDSRDHDSACALLSRLRAARSAVERLLLQQARRAGRWLCRRRHEARRRRRRRHTGREAPASPVRRRQCGRRRRKGCKRMSENGEKHVRRGRGARRCCGAPRAVWSACFAITAPRLVPGAAAFAPSLQTISRSVWNANRRATDVDATRAPSQRKCAVSQRQLCTFRIAGLTV